MNLIGSAIFAWWMMVLCTGFILGWCVRGWWERNEPPPEDQHRK